MLLIRGNERRCLPRHCDKIHFHISNICLFSNTFCKLKQRIVAVRNSIIILAARNSCVCRDDQANLARKIRRHFAPHHG